jgi:FixJ family two-component response regulator
MPGQGQQTRDSGSPVVDVRDVHEYIEAMNLGAFDFVAPPYRSSEIVSIVDGAYRRYRLRRKDEAGLFDQTEELCKAGKSVA